MSAKKATLELDYLRDNIAQKFVGGEKDRSIGLELELLPLQKNAGALNNPLEISNTNKSGVCDWIRAEETASNKFVYTPKSDGAPQFTVSDGGYITFEPGGQLEYSSLARSNLAESLEEVQKNINDLDSILRKHNSWFFFGGVNPWHNLAEIDLRMKNQRYQVMDKYLGSISPYGQCMMRLTTSTQVNLDFGDQTTARERWTAANLLSPIMTAIFSNSPYVNSQYTRAKSFRAIIWQNLDKSRTGFPHIGTDYNSLSIEEQYLEFALNANVIKLPDKSGKLTFLDNNFTFKEWLEKGYNGFFPKLEDWETHLTTLFPEARPKNFIEFRAFDGQSKAWWAVPAILLSAILYDDKAVKQTMDLLYPYYPKLDIMLQHAALKGVKAFPEIAKKVFLLALNSHKLHIDGQLLEYCERFFKFHTLREMSPADHLLLLNNFAVFSPEQYLNHESRNLETANPPESVLTRPYTDISPETLIRAGGGFKDELRSDFKKIVANPLSQVQRHYRLPA